MSAFQREESVGVFFRYQWTQIQDSPMTGFAAYDTNRFMDDYNTGISAYFVHDQTGPIMSNGIVGNYSYHVEIPSYGENSHYFSGGISLGLYQHSLNGDALIVNDLDDPLTIGDRKSAFIPEIGAGIFYYNDYMGFGFSVPQLLGFQANFNGDVSKSSIRRNRHYYAMVHGKVPIGYAEETFLFPSIWFRYAPHSPMNLDIRLKALIDEVFIIGLGYNTANMVSGELGVNINHQYKISYSFTTQFTAWNTYTGDTHELMFIYVIDSDEHGYY